MKAVKAMKSMKAMKALTAAAAAPAKKEMKAMKVTNLSLILKWRTLIITRNYKRNSFLGGETQFIHGALRENTRIPEICKLFAVGDSTNKK
jgi:hypothetical protein